VVTERTQIAMPEVAIGNVPDVGATHLNCAPTRR
jgi:enoyl-CoA hydratase/carnithine racemase